jgi:formylmethanofuran dehydrogenase subunit E
MRVPTDSVVGEGRERELAAMKTLDEYMRQDSKNGDTRSGMILGMRMALLALKELGIDNPAENHRSLIVVVETDRCLPDAIEMIAGCRLGNRSLKFQDMGKMAATFIYLRTGRSVRLAANESANERAREMFPALDREQALRRAYSILSDEDLLTRTAVRVPLAPEDIPGYWAPRIMCGECGEGIAFGREVPQGQRTLCRSCAGEGYCEPV